MKKNYSFENTIKLNYINSNKILENFNKKNFRTKFTIDDDQINFDKEFENSNIDVSKLSLEKNTRDISKSDFYLKHLENGIKNVELNKFNSHSDIPRDDIVVKGWIGIISSIERNKGISRTSNFENKIRIYVNKKLAYDDILQHINSTQVFSKYIEGEIEFDLLDDDRYVDISTSSRQDFIKEDPRFIWLKELIINEVNDLIAFRQLSKKNIESKKKILKDDYYSKVKSEFSKRVETMISDNKTINEVVDFYDKNIKGEVIKDSAKIFISHSSLDAKYGELLKQILLKLGIDRNEIFFSSDKTVAEFDDRSNIYDQMREHLINTKTFVVYLVSKHFVNLTTETMGKSRDTIFEAGAGWVLKYDDYSYSFLGDYSIISDYLKPIDKGGYVYNIFDNDNLIKYSLDVYNKFAVVFFNVIIQHINLNRSLIGKKQIAELEVAKNEKEKNYKVIKNTWKKFI